MPPSQKKNLTKKLVIEDRAAHLAQFGFLSAARASVLSGQDRIPTTSYLDFTPLLQSRTHTCMLAGGPNWLQPWGQAAVAGEIWQTLRFRDAGKRVFQIEHQLARLLASVDLDLALMKWAIPPYDAFYLHFPGDSLGHSDATGIRHNVEGAYCATIRNAGQLVLCVSLVATVSAPGFMDSLCVPLPTDNHTTVRGIIDWMMRERQARLSGQNGSQAAGMFSPGGMPTLGVQRAVEKVLAALIYIGSSGQTPGYIPSNRPKGAASGRRRSSKKLAKLARKVARATGLSRQVFGRDIIVRGQKPPQKGATGSNGGWKIDKRFQVRSHPRWQPYGPGRKLRKLIVVPAHWRGPENGYVWLKNYLVLPPVKQQTPKAGTGASP